MVCQGHEGRQWLWRCAVELYRRNWYYRHFRVPCRLVNPNTLRFGQDDVFYQRTSVIERCNTTTSQLAHVQQQHTCIHAVDFL
jgi:hypothetical protein